MKVHLIFVTKYRRKLFTSEERSDDVNQFLYDAARRYGYKILQMETDGDHIHILLEYGTRAAASTIVKHLKQYSTFWMWKYHENYLSKQYWKKKVL
jgi:putative transposase